MSAAECDTYELKNPSWDAIKLTGFSLNMVAQRELDNQNEIRNHFDFSAKGLKPRIKKHGGLVFLQRMDLPVIASEENAHRATEPFFFVWEYTCDSLNNEKPKLRTFLMGYQGAQKMLSARFGATKPKIHSWGAERLKDSPSSRFVYLQGPLDTAARKEGNVRGDVTSEVHELKLNNLRLHNPLKMNEPIFLLPFREVSEQVETLALPSFMSFVAHFVKENFKETLYFADLVDSFAEREPLDKALAISTGLFNRFGEFIFTPDRVFRSEMYELFGKGSLINFGRLLDAEHYLIRVGLEGLIPDSSVEGGEMIDKFLNHSVSLSLCTLKADGWPAKTDHHLEKQSLMTSVEALADADGHAFSEFSGKLTYCANSHDMKRLTEDLYQITGETQSTVACVVPDLEAFRELALGIWKTIASASNLVVLTFDFKTIEEH